MKYNDLMCDNVCEYGEVSWTTSIWRMVENAEAGKIAFKDFVYQNDKAQNLMLKKLFSTIVHMSGFFEKKERCCWHPDFHPSLMYDFDNHHFYCFGCMESGRYLDVIDFAKFMLDTDKYYVARNFLIEHLVEFGSAVISKRKKAYRNSADFSEKNAAQALSAYSPAALEIKSTRDFLSRKTNGLSDNPANHKYFDVCKQCVIYGKEYIAIQCDNGYFAKRCIEDETTYKYANFKGEKVHLYNSAAITNADTDDVVFIVESALDAIMLQCWGFKAVAMNGVYHLGLVEDVVRNATNKHFSIIIMFDNDSVGRIASRKLWNMIRYHGIYCVEHYTIFGYGITISEKDFGDAYAKDALTAVNECDYMRKHIK